MLFFVIVYFFYYCESEACCIRFKSWCREDCENLREDGFSQHPAELSARPTITSTSLVSRVG